MIVEMIISHFIISRLSSFPGVWECKYYKAPPWAMKWVYPGSVSMGLGQGQLYYRVAPVGLLGRINC